jgi:small-conductance mechanosensitive channel/CRP-like cAMP-binding protein
MQDSLYQTLLPCIAAIVNVVVLLWNSGPRRPVLHAAFKCTAFATLTVVMLHFGIVPTQPAHRFENAELRFVRGALEMGWWLLAAATILSVVRTYYAIGLRLRQRRFIVDVVGTLLYLGSALAIIADVLDIPIKGVLATSGALAIVLGLALQSTLSDLFSGLLINTTSPYRVGDTVALDDSTEGEVVEITWRATHIAKANRDLVVVPNSIIAKSRIVNRSVPAGPHATVAKFEAPSQFRPSDVVHALELAIDTCVGIADTPKPAVATTLVGRKTTTYEVTFFPTGKRGGVDLLNQFYDAAHRHVEAVSAHANAADLVESTEESTLPYRLIDAIGVFGMLSRAQRSKLAAALIRRELAPDQVILAAGETSPSIMIIAYGIVSATMPEHGNSVAELNRFGPREYFGESGPIAGVASRVSFTTRTHVIGYELPGSAVAGLLEEHGDVAHALAAKLIARERKGHALMHASHEVHATHGSLVGWISRCIQAIHHPHLTGNK